MYRTESARGNSFLAFPKRQNQQGNLSTKIVFFLLAAFSVSSSVLWVELMCFYSGQPVHLLRAKLHSPAVCSLWSQEAELLPISAVQNQLLRPWFFKPFSQQVLAAWGGGGSSYLRLKTTASEVTACHMCFIAHKALGTHFVLDLEEVYRSQAGRWSICLLASRKKVTLNNSSTITPLKGMVDIGF